MNTVSGKKKSKGQLCDKDWDCIVLTYDIPHRKTYDTLCLLRAKGYRNVLVWATPLSYVKKFSPLFQHRPPVIIDIHPEELCRNLGFTYAQQKNGYSSLVGFKDVPILVCGAGLLPKELVSCKKVINSHPGYIPLARGLDAFKWAICEGAPIGVTTHLIGDEIDAGEIIDRRQIPVNDNDTFHAVAQRVYEYEIVMLVEALKRIKDGTVYISGGNNPVHKRMPKDIEKTLLCKFESLRKAQNNMVI